MALHSAAYNAHAFEYDATALDQTLVELLQTFYTLSDDKIDGKGWSECFTADAVMKKGTTNVTGREAIAKVNEGSWKGMESRQHIVFKVFPFAPGKPEEVMLYGMSKYLYEDQSTGEMGWAARLHLQRSKDGRVLIDFYHIYPSAPPKAS